MRRNAIGTRMWILILTGFWAAAVCAESALAASADGIIASLSRERAAKTQPIEDPNGAMTPFYEALARTAAKQPGAVTRISCAARRSRSSRGPRA